MSEVVKSAQAGRTRMTPITSQASAASGRHQAPSSKRAGVPPVKRWAAPRKASDWQATPASASTPTSTDNAAICGSTPGPKLDRS
ncbi:hypothetical protein AJ88_45115 [Mesorhizobium amorphae CCBAU 01583]|nr:hypothetical protein AJ88_45115 [Mesorhizobium amorphae CCBAU 01583]